MAKKSLARTTISIGANVAGLQRGLKTASASIKRFGGQAKRIGTTFSAAFTAPLAAIGVQSVKTFQGFEAEMSKVKAVSGATAQEFAKLESEAKRLGATTTFTASEVASLQTEFAKLGFSAKEITQVTESTLFLAQAAGTDLARAAEVAGATLRGFGLDATDTGHLTDVMAKSFSESALDMEAFAEAMKYVAPVANSAGISVEETTAMIELLANAGIKGSQAGTSLRRIISELGATGGNVAGAIEKLANKGLNLADAKDEVGRSAQSALLVLGKTIDQLPALKEGLEGADGAAKAMAATMMDNTAGAFKTLQSATEGALIELGDAIANNEIFKQGLEKLTAVIGKITEYIRGMSDAELYNKTVLAGLIAIVPIIITAVGGLTLAFGSLTAAMGPLGIAIAGVVLAYQAFKKEVSESDEVIKKALESENLVKAQEKLKERLADVNKLLKERKEALARATSPQAQAAQQKVVNDLEAERTKLLDALNKVQEKNTASLEEFRNAQKEYEAEQKKTIETTKKYEASIKTVAKALDVDLYPSQSRVKELLDNTFTQVHSNNLARYQQGLSNLSAPLTQAIDLTAGLGRQIADGFGNAMANMVMSIDEAFTLYNDMVDEGASRTEALTASVALLATSFTQTLGAAIQSIIAQLLAAVTVAAVLAVVLSLATGGIAGTNMQSISTAFKMVTLPAMGIPALAEGGIVTKPTLAMVGEGGESEAVIPLSKLPQIAGGAGGAVEVYGRLSGQDILISTEKANRTRSRYRGF